MPPSRRADSLRRTGALARRADEIASDGRVRRSQRSGQAIVGALFELIGEGLLEPTAQQVAARARVGLRTVFRRFSDMESLFAEMDARLQAEAVPLLIGGATAFAVTDSTGQYRMTDLPVGPYVVRAHREGFAGARSSLIDVRAAAADDSEDATARWIWASIPLSANDNRPTSVRASRSGTRRSSCPAAMAAAVCSTWTRGRRLRWTTQYPTTPSTNSTAQPMPSCA